MTKGTMYPIIAGLVTPMIIPTGDQAVEIPTITREVITGATSIVTTVMKTDMKGHMYLNTVIKILPRRYLHQPKRYIQCPRKYPHVSIPAQLRLPQFVPHTQRNTYLPWSPAWSKARPIPDSKQHLGGHPSCSLMISLISEPAPHMLRRQYQ